MFIFRRTLVEQQLLLWRFFIARQITPTFHGQRPHSLVRLQLASQEPVLVGEVVADQHFFARLAGPLPSKCILAVAHSFTELSRNCRQKTLSADRSHQQGRIRRKAKTRDDGGWLWQSLAFGSLAAALGFCFSRLQKRILASTRNQNFQSYSRNNGMIISAQRTTLYYIVLCIYSVLWWFKISNLRETSAKKTSLAANSTFVRTDVGTLEAFAIKRLTWTIRSSVIYEMLIAFTWTHVYAIFSICPNLLLLKKIDTTCINAQKQKAEFDIYIYIYVYNINYIYIYRKL